VRLILLINLALWTTTVLFPLRDSIVGLTVGMVVYMGLIPYVEAAEQTVLQKVVPYERQGRVFGFAQSVEQSASPLTAFLISPIAQFAFIPFMTDGRGADWIGGWFGTGPTRGIALVFVLTGLLGLALTTYALTSRFYRQLSARYAVAPGPDPLPAPGVGRRGRTPDRRLVTTRPRLRRCCHPRRRAGPAGQAAPPGSPRTPAPARPGCS
jgi:DHA3 family multidrug efflux protein-like MFS transporter